MSTVKPQVQCVCSPETAGRLRGLCAHSVWGHSHLLHHCGVLRPFENSKQTPLFCNAEEEDSGPLSHAGVRAPAPRAAPLPWAPGTGAGGRTFRVEGDERDVVADALAAGLSAAGDGVAGLGAALPVLVVAVLLPRHLHHDGVLPPPGDRAEQETERPGRVRAARPHAGAPRTCAALPPAPASLTPTAPPRPLPLRAATGRRLGAKERGT